MLSRWWLVPLMLWAFFLGARMLTIDVLWFDEAKTVLFAGARHFGPKSVGEIWTDFATTNAWQSPGYYIALSFWAMLTGWSDFAARSLSLLFAMLSLAWLYRLGRDIAGEKVALYAVTFLVGSSLFVHYSHEMRPYALYILMTCVAVWAYWRIIYRESEPQPIHYMMLFGGLVGMAYTHVLALLAAFGMGAYHLLLAPKNRKWLYATGIMVASAIAFLPWAQYTLTLVGEAAEDTTRQAVALFGVELLDETLRSFGNGNLIILVLLLGAAALQIRHQGNQILWFWLIVPLAMAMVLSYIVPAFIHVRYLMSVWAVLALLAAVGLTSIEQRGFPAIVVLAVWLIVGGLASRNLSFYESLPNSHINILSEGFMEATDILFAYTRPQDTVVVHTAPPTEEWASDDIHWYYWDALPASWTHMELIQPFPREATDSTYQVAVNEVIGNRPIVWTSVVPQMPFSRRRLAFFEQLNRSHTFCQQVLDRDDMQLDLYAQQSGETVAMFDTDAVQVNRLWDIASEQTRTLDIFLGITRHPDLPPDSYSVGLHLYDANDALVQQQDYGLSNNGFSCQWTQFTDIPAGQYTLALIVYDWRTGERMALADTTLSDNRAWLANIIVSE